MSTANLCLHVRKFELRGEEKFHLQSRIRNCQEILTERQARPTRQAADHQVGIPPRLGPVQSTLHLTGAHKPCTNGSMVAPYQLTPRGAHHVRIAHCRRRRAFTPDF